MARSRILRMAVPALFIHAGVSLAGMAQAEPTDAERAAAATRTASTNLLCGARVLGPFYWEIGRREGTLVSGSVTPRGSTVTITADTLLSVASASKWVFAAYAVERFGNTASARPFLNLTSGYSNFRTSDCPTDGTVAECLPGSRNRKESTAKMFHYDGGHMQQHAINIGLGPLDNDGLGVEISSILGTQPPVAYAQPGIAGGISTTARDYSAFLRRLLVGATSPLKLGAQLQDCRCAGSLALLRRALDRGRPGDHTVLQLRIQQPRVLRLLSLGRYGSERLRRRGASDGSVHGGG
jgi:hypothetical protein